MEVELNSKKYGKQIVLIDQEDYYLLEKYTWYIWSTKRHNSLYVLGNDTKRKHLRLHRVIMNVFDPSVVIDHINGNALDNRKSNLRITTQAYNNMNSTKRKNAISSKYKGVHFCKNNNKWMAQIQVNKKKHYVKCDSEIEAAIEYNKLAIKFHGKFAKINNLEDCK